MASDFSSPHTRALSTAVHIFGASALSFCFAARIQSTHISFKAWRDIPWARWCTILVFLDSWLFHVWSSLLIQGYGLDRNHITCRMGIYLCIVIYCSSKVLIYSFLIERVYVVWPHAGTRLSSKAFCLCMLMMFGYGVVGLDMLIGRNTFIKEADCVIGLKSFASIPLLSYDLFLNIVLTLLFLWPLQQAHFRDVRLRQIARRTMIAAFVALTTSSINIAVLTVKHGFELGWVCLASCGLDVTINALVIYGVTGYKPDDTAHYCITTMNLSVPATSNMLSSRPPSASIHSTPELSLPPPVQSKHRVYRMSTASFCDSKIDQDNEMIGQEVPEITTPSSPPENGYNMNSLVLRGRVPDYPQAHLESIESIRYGRKLENKHRRRYIASLFSIPFSWMARKQCQTAKSDTPVEIQVTTVRIDEIVKK